MVVTLVVVLLPTITIIKYVAMERLPLEVAFVAAAVESYIIHILTCVAVEMCYHEEAVRLVVAPLLTAVILTYAVVGKLVYEVAICIVVIEHFMILTLTYVATVMWYQEQVVLFLVALFLTSHILIYAVQTH